MSSTIERLDLEGSTFQLASSPVFKDTLNPAAQAEKGLPIISFSNNQVHKLFPITSQKRTRI